MSGAWPWIVLAGLGAFHGVNPAMGWLFAVALGLHRRSRAVVAGRWHRSRSAMCSRLPPWSAAVLLLGLVVDETLLRRAAGILLIGWAAYHALYGARHRVRFGMTVGLRRTGRVVVPDGERAWRRADADPGGAADVPCRIAGRRAWRGRAADRARGGRRPQPRHARGHRRDRAGGLPVGRRRRSCAAAGSISTCSGVSPWS